VTAVIERYFEIEDDVYIKGRWYLADPVDGHGASLSGMFRRGVPTPVDTPVRMRPSKFAKRGVPLDYTVVDAEATPVVHARVAELLLRLAPRDVQLLPATVDGLAGEYFVVNVIAERQCIDEAASRYIEKYTEKDREVFPDKVGRYFMVSGLKIDKSRVQRAKMFRTWGWSAVIVDEEIKSAFETARVKGAKFVEV